MKHEQRTTKKGNVIKAEIKSYRIMAKIDLVTGPLDQRGNDKSKLFANVIPKKVLPKGHRTCLRIAYKKFNGNLLIYTHGFGWTEIEPEKISEVFECSKRLNIDDLINLTYDELTKKEKIEMLNKFFSEKYTNFTKTEKMLMAYLNGKDLNEAEK
jgi:hypothetical protein